jgi:flagellar basal-body rod modification protein FlgD
MSVGSVSNPTSSSSSAATSTSNAADPFANLNLNDFIQMMITELQNQDPTNPMDSSQMLQEITQMGQISTAEQLDTTLTGMETGQNLSNASAMIGMQVEGTDSAGNSVNGTVSSVTISNGSPTLNVGSSTLTLDEITNILPFNASSLLGNGTGTNTSDSSDTTDTTDTTTPTSGS